ncbi:MAG: methyltransferase domain-containing protein [Candidatus Diapherotrites archaeon]|nr:methyltransferase domain-containing protein [Candidatus Diapherotrites archaeon]
MYRNFTSDIAATSFLETNLLKEEDIALSKHAPKVRKIIDLGSGTGRLFSSLRKKYENALITGVELNPKMFLKAKKTASRNNVTLIKNDLIDELHNYRDLDLVLCLGNVYSAFLDVRDRDALLDAVRSSLNEKGKFFIDFRSYKQAKQVEKIIDSTKFPDGVRVTFEEDLNGRKISGSQFYPFESQLKQTLRRKGFLIKEEVILGSTRKRRKILICELNTTSKVELMLGKAKESCVAPSYPL